MFLSGRVNSVTTDLPCIVNPCCFLQRPSRSGSNQVIQVLHRAAAAVDESVGFTILVVVVANARPTYDLSPIVNAQRLAGWSSHQ